MPAETQTTMQRPVRNEGQNDNEADAYGPLDKPKLNVLVVPEARYGLYCIVFFLCSSLSHGK